MTLLLVGTFGFFGLHLLAWLPKSWQLRRQHRLHPPATGGKEYLRFTPYNRMLHIMIIVSFLGLALTGMVLKFAETGWASCWRLPRWRHHRRLDPPRLRGHHLRLLRAAHLRPGAAFPRQQQDRDAVLPRAGHHVPEPARRAGDDRHHPLVLRPRPRPRYGKWTYWEKFDYFAVFWGVAVIGLSGLILWFPEFFTLFLPGWTINVATIIHSEEALLATGFIFTIHFFNTHMRPEKFPMDRVVFTAA